MDALYLHTTRIEIWMRKSRTPEGASYSVGAEKNYCFRGEHEIH